MLACYRMQICIDPASTLAHSRAGSRGQAPGLWRLRQFAPDHFYLGEYYLTYYQQTGLAEEVAFFVDLGDGAMAVLSLMRSTANLVGGLPEGCA